VAKATKAAKTTKAPKVAVQHTWKVTRRNNQTTDVAAESLTVVYGDLVFSTNGVVVRVIGVDTFNDVELVSR
jgi:hypothetical protein